MTQQAIEQLAEQTWAKLFPSCSSETGVGIIREAIEAATQALREQLAQARADIEAGRAQYAAYRAGIIGRGESAVVDDLRQQLARLSDPLGTISLQYMRIQGLEEQLAQATQERDRYAETLHYYADPDTCDWGVQARLALSDK